MICNILTLPFRRDLTQLSDVTASLDADGSSPQIMLESFGRRRAAPMFRTGGAALVAAGSAAVAAAPTLVVTPPVGADQSTLISSAVDASNGGGGGAIIEMGEGGDCSVLFPGDCGSDRDTNSSQDTLNAR